MNLTCKKKILSNLHMVNRKKKKNQITVIMRQTFKLTNKKIKIKLDIKISLQNREKSYYYY